MVISSFRVCSLFLTVASLRSLAALETCASDRPGWASHRTLSIPENKWGNLNDDSWVDAFCCIYTHVEAVTGDTAEMVTYDGDTFEIAGDSFGDIVATAMVKICAMSMGTDDCEQQKACVDAALNRNLNIDGGALGWSKNNWRVTVDGVMGGLSTGNVEFDDNGSKMTFSGDISLVGGGFASVQRNLSPSIDLRSFAGIVVEVITTDNHGQEGNKRPPLGVHLQLHDNKSRWRFAAAFAIPLSSKNGTISRIFIPMEAFNRGSSSGYQCQSCALDLSSVNGIDFYVLFQDGSFELQVKSITAVKKEQYFSTPQIPFASNDAVKDMLESTINTAGYLFNKGYIELCIAVYSTTLNTIVNASGGVSKTMKSVTCDGLRFAALQMTKVDMAWSLRYITDALLADLAGAPRNEVAGWYLPDPSFYDEGEYLCMENGFTSSTKSYVRNDSPNQDRFDGPFKEGQILDINSSNELGRSWATNVEECARLCLIYRRCLSFYFSRQANFGGECRLSIASRVTAESETFSVEAAFLYDYYERNSYTSIDESRTQLGNGENYMDESSSSLNDKLGNGDNYMDESSSPLNDEQTQKCLEQPCGSSSDESRNSAVVYPRKLNSMITLITCYVAMFYL